MIYRRPIDIITFIVRSPHRYRPARPIDAKRLSEMFASVTDGDAIHLGGKLFLPFLFFTVLKKIHLKNRSAANSVFNPEGQ